MLILRMFLLKPNYVVLNILRELPSGTDEGHTSLYPVSLGLVGGDLHSNDVVGGVASG